MTPKCNLYFQQGAQAALIAGMTPEDMAACNIYRIQHGTRSSGLGRGGKRSTRKKSRRGSKSKSRRVRRRGSKSKSRRVRRRGSKSKSRRVRRRGSKSRKN